MLTIEQIREEYDTVLAKYEEVSAYIDLEEKKIKINKLREKTLDPNFWNDNISAQKVTKEISDLEFEIKRWKDLKMLKQDIELQWMLHEEGAADLNDLVSLVKKVSQNIYDLEIEKLKEYDTSFDSKSWGYEEGILITGNEALTIIKACEGKPDSDTGGGLHLAVVSRTLLLDKIKSLRTTKEQKDARSNEGLYEVAGWETCLNTLENWINDGCNCG